jgi:hypothetical protein
MPFDKLSLEAILRRFERDQLSLRGHEVAVAISASDERLMKDVTERAEIASPPTAARNGVGMY